MNRPSARLVLVGMTLCVLGGSAAVASAAGTQSNPPKHMVCLINQDGPTGPQHGLCVVVPLSGTSAH